MVSLLNNKCDLRGICPGFSKHQTVFKRETILQEDIVLEVIVSLFSINQYYGLKYWSEGIHLHNCVISL